MDTLLEIINRQPSPEPWSEGEKIPWNEPGFSQRMLREHLSQEHDAASRRFEIIDQQVSWIHEHLLSGKATRILDLGCGPGLYASRLAALGHSCTGIDFSPASIAYARENAQKQGLACTYIQDDIRRAEYGEEFGLVMLIYGEFNMFKPADAEAILRKAQRALVEGGILLLEAHTYRAVREIGLNPSRWKSAQSGLFSDRPHLCLYENLWNKDQAVAIERYFIVDGQTGEVDYFSSSMQAYRKAEYRELLRRCGFRKIRFYPSLMGSPEQAQKGFTVIVAQKGED